MICLRAPLGALPVIGTVVTPQLVVVGHLNHDHETVGSGDYVSWYVTPTGAEPTWYERAPDDAAAGVDVAAVQQGVASLENLFPLLAEAGPDIEASVFAGFKQNLDGLMTERLFASVNDGSRIYLALPSILAHAFRNARDAVSTLGRADERPSDHQLAAADDGLRQATVGKVQELSGHVDWCPWSQFRVTYGRGSLAESRVVG